MTLATLTVALSLQLSLATTTNQYSTPQLGYNNCNYDCCSASMPSSDFVESTARSLISRGFRNAGYIHLTIDDCWMLETRDDAGRQIADPSKFPKGISNLTEFAHENGMLFGIYTAMHWTTCAGKMGSCLHFATDAKQYADWGVDYLKFDSCGGCSPSVLSDIESMQASLQSTGRPIRLVVEGDPPVETVSANPMKFGNARRVGHDIFASWLSMLSLVDIGSGLHPFAHNDTGLGGFFNDLDMMEIGNGEFNETAANSLALNRAHFTMWIVMKAPILLSTLIWELSDELVSILTNPEAISIHQDSLGVQARRVSSQVPRNAFPLTAPQDAIVSLAPCDSDSLTQLWRHDNATSHLWTVDEQGEQWCIGPTHVMWGRPSQALPCNDPKFAYNASQDCSAPAHICNMIASWNIREIANTSVVTFNSPTGAGTLAWDNTQYASGPLPHTRWIASNPDLMTLWWQFDKNIPTGSQLRPIPGTKVYDDDHVGSVIEKPANEYCVDVTRAGNVEVWAAPLVQGKYAVAILNRTPVEQPATVAWTDIGISDSSLGYSVRDIWGAKTAGVFSERYECVVGAHDAVLLVLSPEKGAI